MNRKCNLTIKLMFAISVLSGCSHNSGGGGNKNGGNHNKPNENIEEALVLQQKDLDSFNYQPPSLSAVKKSSSLSTPTPQCSSDNKVCISNANAIIGGSYYTGLGGMRYWVIPQVNYSYAINFNDNVSNFKLSSLVGDIDTSQSATGVATQNDLSNVVNGLISQIDTSTCDTLAASGSTKGKTCHVSFLYTATNYNSTAELDITSTFSWDGGTIDFVQQTANINYSSQSVPVINDMGGAAIHQFGSIVENQSASDLEYAQEMGFQEIYINNGNSSIVGVNGLPSIALSLATTNRYSVDPIQIFYTDQLMTNCDDGSVLVGGRCTISMQYNLLLNNYTDQSSGVTKSTILTQNNFLTAQYNNNITSAVPYVRSLTISTGDYKGINTNVDLLYSAVSDPDPLYINRAEYGDVAGFLNYAPVESNLAFVLRYEPYYHLGAAILNNKVIYGIDGYSMDAYSTDSPSTVISGAQLASQIPIIWDADCFNNLPAYNNGQGCMVGIEGSSPIAAYITSKPIGLNLYATYFSPVENRYVDQFIANINLYRDPTDNRSVAPNGIYLYGNQETLHTKVAAQPNSTYSVAFNNSTDASNNIISGSMSDFFKNAYIMTANGDMGLPIKYAIGVQFDSLWNYYSAYSTDINGNYNSIQLNNYGSTSGCVIWQVPPYSLICPVTFTANFLDGITHTMTCNISMYYLSRVTVGGRQDDFAVNWMSCQNSAIGMSYSLDSIGEVQPDHALGLYVNMLN